MATKLIYSAIIAVLLVSLGSRELTSSQSKAAPKIYVSDFQKDNVIGNLGFPLGTVVRITGTIFDGEEIGSKALSSETMMKVMTVNGHKIPSPPVFIHPGKKEDRPVPGSTFDYYVHESGAFRGVVDPPQELGIQYEPIAHDGFYYHSELVIHKNNHPAPKHK